MARLGDNIYFSRKYRFSDLVAAPDDLFLDAFEDRVHSFYLHPAQLLLEKRNEVSLAFGVGVIGCATIDFIALYDPIAAKEPRVQTWLEQRVPEFSRPDQRINAKTPAQLF